MPAIETRPIDPATRAAVDALTARNWAGTRIYDASGVFETSDLPGAVAFLDGAFAGAVT